MSHRDATTFDLGRATTESPSASGSRDRQTVDREPLSPGTIIAGRYRVISLLGRGGMGEVYRVDDIRLGQQVALKFLPPKFSDDTTRLQRLLDEVRIGRQVAHPNVCRIYDIVEAGERVFLSMEYVDGEDAATLLSRIGRLPYDKALQIARDICAGLLAVHEKGIVHRDLKPANVMIDGQGHARLTDFGLAAPVTQNEKEKIFGGTPIYMAPEQLTQGEISAKSDIYSLGLVLFEMFTGRRVFDGGSFSDLVEQHRQSKERPTSLVPEMEPRIERLIMSCLEENPDDRPPSVKHVLALLPGGDPLEAARAAGETPSPAMVAASRIVGDLTPAQAMALGTAIVITMFLAAVTADHITIVRRLDMPKPAAVLEEKAVEVLKAGRLNVEERDAASTFAFDREQLRHLRKLQPKARLGFVLNARPPIIRFLHRRSPDPLATVDRTGQIGSDDPPLDVAGMVNVGLDHNGNLVSLRAFPPQKGVTPAFDDWDALFERAGLDLQSLVPITPEAVPPLAVDRRFAWRGRYEDAPNEVTIEAGTYRGALVWFDIAGPWRVPKNEIRRAANALDGVSEATNVIIFVVPMAAAVIVARRNLRLQRGDQLGATRIALFIFGALTLGWALRAHHVADITVEWEMLLTAMGGALLWAAMVWFAYIAVEPYVRKHWPEVLISWIRVWGGRFRDPMVGRDVLIGLLIGLGTVAITGVLAYVPMLFDSAPVLIESVRPQYFNSIAAGLGKLAESQFRAVQYALGFLFSVIGLTVAFGGRRRLALSVWVLVLVVGFSSWDAGEYYVDVVHSIVVTTLLAWAFVRFGVLALAVGYSTMFAMLQFPLTLDFRPWYSSYSVIGYLLISAAAVYGWRTALGGQPVLGLAFSER